jgi:hypothetical protein
MRQHDEQRGGEKYRLGCAKPMDLQQISRVPGNHELRRKTSDAVLRPITPGLR